MTQAMFWMNSLTCRSFNQTRNEWMNNVNLFLDRPMDQYWACFLFCVDAQISHVYTCTRLQLRFYLGLAILPWKYRNLVRRFSMVGICFHPFREVLKNEATSRLTSTIKWLISKPFGANSSRTLHKDLMK